MRLKKLKQTVLIIFILINIFTYIGAYFLTHFSVPGQLGFGNKPSNSIFPSDVGLEYITQKIALAPTEWLETWLIPTPSSSSQGTVLLFPGNRGSKGGQHLAPARVFHQLGYNCLLVDFRGVGGSSGNTTTIGAKEAKDVAIALNYAEQIQLTHPFVLYGVSMGSAAILKAIATEKIQPDAIVLELPFARLVSAVRSRLRVFHFPVFPTAELLVFWGGIQHGFNGFAHNPIIYAKQVRCPTLVFHGGQDKWTNIKEIERLVVNLQGKKQLIVFPTAGHQLLVTVDRNLWRQNIQDFLKKL
ncbi:MAG: alpha/beta hydrolase [Xenococcaceae cyanobacterium]